PRWPQGGDIEQVEDVEDVEQWALPDGSTDFYGWLETKIPAELCRGLEAVAARLSVSLKSVLLAVHGGGLARVAGQRDVVTGYLMNGRLEEPGSTEPCGMFLNSVPLRANVSGLTWAQLVRYVFGQEREALAHRRFPSAEMQRIVGGGPLYES